MKQLERESELLSWSSVVARERCSEYLCRAVAAVCEMSRITLWRVLALAMVLDLSRLLLVRENEILSAIRCLFAVG